MIFSLLFYSDTPVFLLFSSLTRVGAGTIVMHTRLEGRKSYSSYRSSTSIWIDNYPQSEKALCEEAFIQSMQTETTVPMRDNIDGGVDSRGMSPVILSSRHFQRGQLLHSSMTIPKDDVKDHTGSYSSHQSPERLLRLQHAQTHR